MNQYSNINKIKDDFPIFKNNPDLIFLDNASTTQKPQQVINSISNYYENYNSNIHRGIYKIAEKSTAIYENTRVKTASFIGAKQKESVVFTRGTTESINLIANSWGQNLKENDEVLITEMEHHSNIIPWQLICKKTGAKLKYIPIQEDGNLDLIDPDKYFNKNTKIVSIIHQSNVLGTINPIRKIIEMAHNVNALVVLDGAQSIPHQTVDVSNLNCDFFVFSGHKMLGPTGVGVLYSKPELLNKMEPFMGGGQMISNVSMKEATWNDIPWKFEAGTPSIAQVVGLGASIDYLLNIGMDKINEHGLMLLDYANEKLKNIPEITIYGKSKNKGPVISFNINNIHPHDIAQILDQSNIAIRAGHHCAQPIMKKNSISSTNRISFYIYNQINEIDKLLISLNKIIKFFK
tara:strand:+ start:571 stop:1785 length:1215 start_codon:yes stop_codon:yes gene_type:complete